MIESGIALLPWIIPWIVVGAFITFGIREPRPLPPARDPARRRPFDDAPAGESHRVLPSVTIIVPARNEARNIVTCLTSLTAQQYPDFSIIVVDDRSTDETRERASSVPLGNASRIEVVEGEPLPEGWFGKPWACFQGARRADGRILLFTDADTRHDPSLLDRAVRALYEDGAQALSLLGKQEMGSFYERLLQPQMFALLGMRFNSLSRGFGPESSDRAIANGQYVMIRRDAYFEAGGHEAVRGEVVEDLRLAQVLTAAGNRLTFRSAQDTFSTRMYQSFREISDGWTKNIAVGARLSTGRWSSIVVPGIVGFLVLFWIVPPAALGVTGLQVVFPFHGFPPAPVEAPPVRLTPIFWWSAVATFAGIGTWARLYSRSGVSVAYSLLYPLGAVLTAFIVLRSWVRGERLIEWKGRSYLRGRIPHGAEGEA